jgi:nucleotide-binding universal stress UspA family protein
MYENILVPTDGSETANFAVHHAIDIAEQYGSTLHSLYVIDVDATSYGLGAEQVDRIRQGNLDEMPEVKDRATKATSYVAEKGDDHGIAVENHYRIGEPSRSIRNFVEDSDIDLVVMGSHGRSGLSRVVLGSVAEKVLRRTHLPVLVVDSEE